MAGTAIPSPISHLPSPTLLVAESGIHARGDIDRLVKCGAKAILVGESLVRHGDIRAKVKELLG
jgi:indole-3-glycerol phosphate synthase